MPHQEPSLEWIETHGAVTVRLPAPPGDPPAMSWATAALILMTLLLLVTTLFFAWYAISASPREATFWLTLIVLIAALGGLLWGTIVRLRREARAPRTPAPPSTLVIADGVLKVERAGPDRDMDYSWELSEIADLSMSNAASDRALPTPGSLLAEGLRQEQVIRISVERRSGEVDDISVLSTGRHWAASLETRLRDHLKRLPGAATT